MYRLLERGGMKQIGVKVNEMLLTICKGQIHEYSRPLIKGKAMVFSQIRGKKSQTTQGCVTAERYVVSSLWVYLAWMTLSVYVLRLRENDTPSKWSMCLYKTNLTGVEEATTYLVLHYESYAYGTTYIRETCIVGNISISL